MANPRRLLPIPASTSTCPIISRRWRNRAGLAPTGAVGNATLVVLVPPCGYRAGCLALRPKPHCHDHGGMAAATDQFLASRGGLLRGGRAVIVSLALGSAGCVLAPVPRGARPPPSPAPTCPSGPLAPPPR